MLLCQFLLLQMAPKGLESDYLQEPCQKYVAYSPCVILLSDNKAPAIRRNALQYFFHPARSCIFFRFCFLEKLLTSLTLYLVASRSASYNFKISSQRHPQDFETKLGMFLIVCLSCFEQ